MKKTSCPGKGKRKYLDIFKKWRRSCIPCVLLSLGVGLCISTSLAQTLLNDIPFSKLETEIKTLMESWCIPGMSICIIRNGEIAWHRGLGVKNAQTGEPVNDQTIFQAASMSKPVFAYAVLKMCDEGLIDLDKPLVDYVPQEFIEKTFLGHSMDLAGFKKEWFSKITARMCLSHSSGLQHFGLKAPVEILFEPGTQFWYSSNGIEYLRYIVEKLKGSRIDTLIVIPIVEKLERLGFKMVATEGTTQYLRRHGFRVDTVGKVFREKRNILEYIKEGKVGMIFNTPSGTYERRDARKIRTVAFSYRVPCFTTIPSASAAVNAIEARKKSSPSLLCLQDIHSR